VLGSGPLMDSIIPDRPMRNRYSDVYLRNGGNSYLILPHKDASQVKMMSKGTNNYYSAWRPVTVYINGNYWGLYELREKTNPEMFEISENANPGSVEILSSTSQYGFTLRAIEGSVESFYNSYQAFKQINPADSSFWEQADQYFDLNNYNDYIIAETWMDNVDWGINNIKLYRSDKSNYRWRYCLIDMEYGLLPNEQPDLYNCQHNFLAGLLASDSNNPHLNIWLRGIKNHRFRNYFINRFADQMNTHYLPSRLIDIENEMYNQTLTEMPKEFWRWGDSTNIPGQMNAYYENHMLFQSELNCRPERMRNHILEGFQLPRQVEVFLDANPPEAGQVSISTVTPENYPWTGIYFDGVPVKIEAKPRPGFQFSHWEGNGLITDTLNPVFMDTLNAGNGIFKAHFISTTGVPKSTESAFIIFPNPTSGLIKIQSSDRVGSLQKLSLVDVCGKVTVLPFFRESGHTFSADISQLPKGFYHLKYHSASGKIFHCPLLRL
jgi:hypothetical protein